MLMEVMLEEKMSLHELSSGITKFPQYLKNVKVSDKSLVMNNEKILSLRDEISNKLGDEGRILLRESGTEPVIRVMVEAQSDEICEKYVDRMICAMKTEGLAD